MADPTSIGKAAEIAAAKYLKKLGYNILETNYRGQYGEIDIIANENKCLVFIEVKYRSSSDFGRPEEFVGKSKQLKIIKTALQYLKKERLEGSDVRFDVLTIDSASDKIGLIRSAFESTSRYTC